MVSLSFFFKWLGEIVQRMMFCSMQILKSKHFIRIQTHLHYVLPTVVSCYKGKLSCDRLDCMYCLQSKNVCSLASCGQVLNRTQIVSSLIPPPEGAGSWGPTSGAEVGHMTDFSLYTCPTVEFLKTPSGNETTYSLQHCAKSSW